MLHHKKTINGDHEETVESDADVTPEEEEDDNTDDQNILDGYDHWESVIDKASEKSQEQFEMEVRKLMENSNMDKTNARNRVHMNMKQVYRKAVTTVLMNRLIWFNAIQRHPIYKDFRGTVNNLIEIDSYQRDEA